MTELRIINLLIWGGLLFSMLPGAWGAISSGHTRAVSQFEG